MNMMEKCIIILSGIDLNSFMYNEHLDLALEMLRGKNRRKPLA